MESGPPTPVDTAMTPKQLRFHLPSPTESPETSPFEETPPEVDEEINVMNQDTNSQESSR